MKTLPLLCLALLLAACGEPASGTPEAGAAAATLPAATLPAGLAPRAEPLAVGDTAPGFDGFLPGGKAVVVFYRGPW